MRRTLALLLLGIALLSGCGGRSSTTAQDASCTPPAGGRCAGDVAWTGPIRSTDHGLRLGNVINCGGTLHASETADRVTVTLHVSAMGPGTMSCARVPVWVTLASPLGSRTVVDGVSGHQLSVTRG